MKGLYIFLIVLAILLIAGGGYMCAHFLKKHVDQNNKKDIHIFGIIGGAVLIIIGFFIIVFIIIKNSRTNKAKSIAATRMDTDAMSDITPPPMKTMSMQAPSPMMASGPNPYLQPMYNQGMMTGIPGGYSQTQWNAPIPANQGFANYAPSGYGYQSQFS
jgi:hypothetical protein